MKYPPQVDSESSRAESDSERDSSEEYDSEEEWHGIVHAASEPDDETAAGTSNEEKTESNKPVPTGKLDLCKNRLELPG